MGVVSNTQIVCMETKDLRVPQQVRILSGAPDFWPAAILLPT
jgi:hypothetical protein